ncbi:MAG: methionine synthase [Anaerolineaceae bacterium]|nr:methionine synthase [Anaerolineaceae bacterium]
MKTIVAAAIGECVHVAGVSNFLRLAERAGYETIFLGPATPIHTFLEALETHQPEIAAVSYRLTPETGERLLAELAESADEFRERGVRFIFGGTPPVAERAAHIGFFEEIFDGSQSTEEIIAYLRGESLSAQTPIHYPDNTIDRIRWKAPYPILRHHYGQPTMEETLEGVRRIAEAKVLDVISLGIDQDAQANFYHPERQNPRQRGAGGVPVRSADDYRALFTASRTGNFPLMRTYSGTDDFIRLAEMYLETIRIAWCAVPIFWFNQMDGRGPLTLQDSIREHQELMRWYAEHNIPVELNESHHWGMRDASDVIFLVSSYLSAYNAKAFGVENYIAQMMFNSPSGLSDRMDLAKMLAVLEMIKPLEDNTFHIYRQTRTGLLSYPLDPDEARAHLAASIYLQVALKPHIVHVVSYSEAHHAATADDVIESCKMARRVIDNAVNGQPDLTADPAIQQRKDHLIREAQVTLNAIRSLSNNPAVDPLVDPAVLTRAVNIGIMDAPQLRSNAFAPGKIRTAIIDGACEAIDQHRNPLSEAKRAAQINLEQ